MSRHVEFRRLLGNGNALRVRFIVEQGQVIQFVVQLECLFEGKWAAVVRYDTAHGFAHCDRLHPYEPSTKTRLKTSDYNQALTFAIGDLTANWQEYHERYEQWLKERPTRRRMS